MSDELKNSADAQHVCSSCGRRWIGDAVHLCPLHNHGEFRTVPIPTLFPLRDRPASCMTIWHEAAMRAMEGLLASNVKVKHDFNDVALWACEQANSLLAEMQRREENTK